MFRFEHSYLLWALLLIPVIVIVYVIQLRAKKKELLLFADVSLLPFLIPSLSKTKPFLKMVLQSFGILLVIIAIANPQLGSKLEEVKREGVDIMICLDVSNSMRVQDLAPNRLEHAKQSISKLVDNLKAPVILMSSINSEVPSRISPFNTELDDRLIGPWPPA